MCNARARSGAWSGACTPVAGLATGRGEGECLLAPGLIEADLRQALLDFQRTYNEEWIIQRHGYRTPAHVRREQTTIMQTAA